MMTYTINKASVRINIIIMNIIMKIIMNIMINIIMNIIINIIMIIIITIMNIKKLTTILVQLKKKQNKNINQTKIFMVRDNFKLIFRCLSAYPCGYTRKRRCYNLNASYMDISSYNFRFNFFNRNRCFNFIKCTPITLVELLNLFLNLI